MAAGEAIAVPSELAAAAARIQGRAPALAQNQVDFLSDIIRLRSHTGEEGPAVQRTVAEMEDHGFDDVRIASAGDALGTVGSGAHHLLYDAHLDHNEVADESDWPYPPLEPTIVYGARLAAELDLTADCTVTVQGATLEEDAEGFAMRHLIEKDHFHRPDAVLLAEATDLTLRRGHRGRCEVRVRTKGKAVHASTPELGENAILKMRPVLDALEAMVPDLPVDEILGQGTQVITMVSAPHTPNSVPSWCEATIDRRLTPGETPETVVAEIEAAVAGLDASVEVPIQPVSTWTGLDLSGPAFFPGWLLDADDQLVEAGKLACIALWGKAPRVDVWQFSTNGTYSAGVAGIPSLGFGPMEEEWVHSAEDQVDLEKLLKAAMFYAAFPLAYTLIREGRA